MSRALHPSERRAILALGDAGAAAVAVALAVWTWTITAGLDLSPAVLVGHRWWFAAVPIWTLALASTRDGGAARTARALVSGLLRAAGWLFACYLAAYFWGGPDRLPRLLAVYILWNAVWLTVATRAASAWVFAHSRFRQRALIVGTDPLAAEARALFEAPALRDVEVIGVVSDVPELPGAVTHVVVAMTDVPPATLDGLMRCQERGIEVVTFVRLYEDVRRRIPIRHVGRAWVLSHLFSGAGLRERSPLAKRALDLVGAVGLFVVGVVPAAVAAVLTLVDSGRPILYSQTRVGRGGRPFTITKFRTMRVDAERHGPQWSPEQDPRVTRVGAWLRATHFDEWPNLLAVLRGDMSLVGPRPERPEFVAMLESEVPLYRARLSVAPGLTGWAQVRTGYGDSVDDQAEKLEFDLYYAAHQSVWFDVSILARTVGRTLGRRGR